MAALVWNVSAEKFYESGMDRGTLYVRNGSGLYTPGVAWEGLISVTEKPGGAEATDLWANNVLYSKLVSPEIFDGAMEAYQFPDEWWPCDGVVADTITGAFVHQQARSTFGLAYRTRVGSDQDGAEAAYKIHLIYGCLVAPSEVARTTINDSPEAATFSWEFKTTPVSMTGYSALSKLTFDTRTLSAGNLTVLESQLWGLDDVTTPNLPLPDTLFALFT